MPHWYFLDYSTRTSFQNGTVITRSRGYTGLRARHTVWYGQHFYIWWNINHSYFGAYNPVDKCLKNTNQYGRLRCQVSQNVVWTDFYFSILASNMKVAIIAIGKQIQLYVTVEGECLRTVVFPRDNTIS